MTSHVSLELNADPDTMASAGVRNSAAMAPVVVFGMRVSIRTNPRNRYCPSCGGKYSPDNDFTCCGTVPRLVYIEVAFKGEGREFIRTDLDGDPLEIGKAKRLAARIEQDAKLCATDLQAKRMVRRAYIPRDREKHRFGSVARDYLAHMRRKRLKNEISKGYLQDLEAVFRNHLDGFADMDVADITTGVVEDWLETYDALDYRKSVCVKYLFRALRHASRKDYINKTPDLPELKSQTMKRHGVGREVQTEILSHIPERHRPVFEFYAVMGWRPAEVRALKVRDIQGDTIYLNGSFDREEYRPYPKARGKGGAPYPLERIAGVIAQALEGRVYGPDDYVFGFKSRGVWRRYTHRYMSKIYGNARKAAGYPKVTLYEFGRHAVAYQLFLAGATKEQIAAILNNTGGTVQEHYTTVTKDIRGQVYNLCPVVSEGEPKIKEG